LRRIRLIAVFVSLIIFLVPIARGDEPTLKDALKDDFLVGTCLDGHLPDFYPPACLAMVTQQFNAVTPENCMKGLVVHPSENTWKFENADALVQFAQDHHMAVFGHALVWHSQAPGWMFVDGSKRASRDLLLQRLKTHIQTEVGRYKGKIKSWDVVNEVIRDNGAKPGGHYLRTSSWQRIIGDDFVEQAFRFAHEADPDAELQYNDYSIESGQKHQSAMEMLRMLKAHNVPITSVGIQGHFVLDRVPFDDLDKAISDFHSLGLKVSITEMDMDVLRRRNLGASIEARETTRESTTRESTTRPTTQAAITPAILQRQADQYAKLFAIFHKHRDAIERVTFWGADDGHSWLNTWPYRRTNAGMVFDRQYQPKPAFYAILKAVGTAGK
jgi:endo-1,4-beta-xylanase